MAGGSFLIPVSVASKKFEISFTSEKARRFMPLEMWMSYNVKTTTPTIALNL